MSAAPPGTLLPVATTRETAGDIVGRLRSHRALAALTVATLFAAAATALVVPPLLGDLVDVAVEQRPSGDAVGPAVALAVAAIVSAGLTAAGAQLVARLGETVLAGLREEVVDRALDLGPAEIERAGSGDLVSRVSNDVRDVSTAVREIVPPLAEAILVVGLTVVGLALLDVRLAAAVLVALPVHALGLRHYLRTVVPVYRRQREAEGERTQELVAAIGGARTARALGLGADRLERVRVRSRGAADLSLYAVRLQAWRFLPVLNGAELLALGAVLGVGFGLVRSDAVTVGTATAAALYVHRAFDPVGVLLFLFDDALEAMTALARLVGIASAPPSDTAAGAGGSDGGRRAPAPVAVLGVGHHYVAGHPVLRDVTLDLAPGERVAVVGPSGAGKSTLARLVAGVLAPTDGAVHVAGRPPARDGDAAARVALVTQEVHVFSGPLREDLRLAAPGADDARLWAALETVGAGAWVKALRHGLATVVGDGGRALTAAQAQQLALARLVLRDPAVAVLDEATAEAGSAGARELERAADRALAGRTALVVAHRMTQAASADRVVVLDGGRVVEVGSHDDLLAAHGPYADLWRAWDRPR